MKQDHTKHKSKDYTELAGEAGGESPDRDWAVKHPGWHLRTKRWENAAGHSHASQTVGNALVPLNCVDASQLGLGATVRTIAQ